MKRYPSLALGVSAAALIATLTLLSADEVTMPNTGLADPAAFQFLYDSWRAAGGGGPVMTLPLISFPVVSSENIAATGEVQVNAQMGKVTSQVFGLPAGDWELWLIDNARNTTSLPGGDDRIVSAGRYRAGEGGAYVLEAMQPDNQPADFEIDRVALTRAGQHPATQGFVLLGSANIYERVARGIVREDIAALVSKGRALFHQETFQGNGRACGTCHVETNNFTVDPAFIATLPVTDPLFVHERTLGLNRNFENARALRTAGLVLGNADGMDDLASKFVLRAVQPIQALGTQIKAPRPEFVTDFSAINPATNPPERLGWGNDNLPLREFAIGAIIQHMPKSIDRRNGADYRLPSDEELDAIAAYMLSIGRREDFDLAKLKLNVPAAAQGQRLYTDTGNIGEPGHKNCNACHFNAGGTGAYSLNGDLPGFVPKLDGLARGFNVTTGTNVNALPAPGGLLIPRDGGFGAVKLPMGSFGNFGFIPGVGAFPVEEFNSMSVVESADTAPYFHNHSVATLEEAVAFYGSKAYSAVESIGDPVAGPIPVKISDNPKDPEVQAISTFLRVLNALENIRSAMSAARRARIAPALADGKEIAALAREEVVDGFEVLSAGSLASNADFTVFVARTRLTAARVALEAAREAKTAAELGDAVERALGALRSARETLADVSTLPASFRQ